VQDARGNAFPAEIEKDYLRRALVKVQKKERSFTFRQIVKGKREKPAPFDRKGKIEGILIKARKA